MLDVDKLTFSESLFIYQGLSELTNCNYSPKERTEINRLKSEIRESVVKNGLKKET